MNQLSFFGNADESDKVTSKALITVLKNLSLSDNKATHYELFFAILNIMTEYAQISEDFFIKAQSLKLTNFEYENNATFFNKINSLSLSILKVITPETKSNIKEKVKTDSSQIIAISKSIFKIYITKQILDIEYYNNSSSLITDEGYDEIKSNLTKILQNINTSLPDFEALNLTNDIGAKPTSKHKKIKHQHKMYSLANSYSIEDIKDFMTSNARFLKADSEEIEFTVQPKIDGNAFCAHYCDGKLINAASRGDGLIGEDITDNMSTILPNNINNKEELWVFGECYTDNNDFNEVNELLFENKFSTPRNYTAGSLRLLNRVEEFKSRKIKYICFNAIFKNNEPRSEIDLLHKLNDMEFRVINSYNCKGLKGVQDQINKIDSERSGLPFMTDGAVIKINSKSFQKRLDHTSHHPKFAISYKFPAEKAKSTLLSVDYQVGRTGAITPVAIFEPVTIGGVQVSKSTLHNFNQMKFLNLHINDTITIERAGEVIPHIVKSEANSKLKKISINVPKECPDCKSVLVKEKEGDVVLRCKNHLHCKSQIIQNLIHFASKKAFNIKGLGSQNIKNFFNIGLISNYSTIFDIPNREDLEEILIGTNEGWGAKSISNLIESIQEARKVDFYRLIYGLGIRHVGLETAKLIADEFNNPENLISLIIAGSLVTEIESIDGIGSEAAKSIAQYFNNDNIKAFKELVSKLEVLKPSQIIANSKFSGQSIMFTGSLSQMSRDEAKSTAIKLGMKVKSTISKKLDYLVVGEKPGSKKNKAEEMGIKIINEEEWIKIISS